MHDWLLATFRRFDKTTNDVKIGSRKLSFEAVFGQPERTTLITYVSRAPSHRAYYAVDLAI